MRLELEWIGKGGALPRSPSRPRRLRNRREALAWTVAAIGIGVSLLLALVRGREVPGEPTRFVVSPPTGTTIGIAENRTRIAISPNGRRLAMLAFTEGKSRDYGSARSIR